MADGEESEKLKIENKDVDKDEKREPEEDDAGIFDEILEGEEDEEAGDDEVVFLDEMLEDNVGDFSIGDVILSTGGAERGWSRQDLEEALRQERIAKDWEDSGEFVGSEFGEEVNGSKDFYGGRKSEDDFYKSGKDFYREGSRGGGTYETRDLYSGKGGKNEEGVYEARGLKSYDEFARKGEPSVLESMGYEGEGKDKRRDFREYSAKQ